MAGFYYYLAGAKLDDIVKDGDMSGGILHDGLRPYGLADSLADCQQAARDVIVAGLKKGPDDESRAGVLLYVKPNHEQGPPEVLGICTKGRQKWTQYTDKLYIGHLVENHPAPEDLERKRQYSGWNVPDRHSQKWLVPVARSPKDDRVAIPQRYTFNAAGEMTSMLVPEFERLWELSGKVWDHFQAILWYQKLEEPGDEDLEQLNKRRMSKLDMAAAAAVALATNYRVGPYELAALSDCQRSPLDDDTIESICVSLVDQDVLVLHNQKKTDGNGCTTPASSNLKPGEPDGAPTSGPAEANLPSPRNSTPKTEPQADPALPST